MTINYPACIVGTGEAPQGRSDEPSTMLLHQSLVKIALDDAGVDIGEVDALLTVSPRSDPYLVHATALAESMHIQPEIAYTLEAGGMAPVVLVGTAQQMLGTLGADAIVVCVAADMPLSAVGRGSYTSNLAIQAGPIHPLFEAPAGPTVPSMFALVASAYLHRYGLQGAVLAELPLQNRRMAANHPNAHMREPISFEDYESSRDIATPLKLIDCAPVSDGGGAVVVTGERRAQSLGVPYSKTIGWGMASSHMHLTASRNLVSFSAGDSLDRALRAANMRRSEIDIACLYDCFSIAGLVNIEDMGLAPRGESWSALADGYFGHGGGGPVLNPHGGLLSHGHPARAGGMGNLIEAATQLRGRAGARQLHDADVAVVHGMAGVFAGHASMLMSAG